MSLVTLTAPARTHVALPMRVYTVCVGVPEVGTPPGALIDTWRAGHSAKGVMLSATTLTRPVATSKSRTLTQALSCGLGLGLGLGLGSA